MKHYMKVQGARVQGFKNGDGGRRRKREERGRKWTTNKEKNHSWHVKPVEVSGASSLYFINFGASRDSCFLFFIFF